MAFLVIFTMIFDRIPWTILFNTLIGHPVKIYAIITAIVIVIVIVRPFLFTANFFSAPFFSALRACLLKSFNTTKRGFTCN